MPDPSCKKMKKLIRKILAGSINTREYVTLTTNKIEERVYLEVNKQVLDVSQNQWVLCLEPLVFGIWIEDKKIKIEIEEKKRCLLIFESANDVRKKVAIAELGLSDKIEEDAGSLFLLKLTHCRVHHFSWLKTYLLFATYYKKRALSFKRFKSLVTAYSYPRKVRIISFRSGDHYNIFPMDFVGEIKTNNKMVFGLRHTNRTLSKIIETKKIIASEIPFIEKDTIYKLGSHHSSAPPPPGDLSFKIFESRIYHFYVPEWAESYKEIRIIKTINLGSHMLLWGDVTNEVILKPATSSLYHVHFLHYLRQKKKGREYRLV